MQHINKYLKIVDWARARYGKNGNLIISIGLNPSRFKMIEDLAGEKYMGFDRHYPNHNIKTAVKF